MARYGLNADWDWVEVTPETPAPVYGLNASWEWSTNYLYLLDDDWEWVSSPASPLVGPFRSSIGVSSRRPTISVKDA